MEFSPLSVADLVASLLLALAASCRARVYGATYTGALVLGCLAGLVSPVVRDVLLLGVVTPLYNSAYAAAVMVGSVLGCFAAMRQAPRLFPLAEALSLGLASALGASCGLIMGLPPVGAILLGVCSGTMGGLMRDVCLGDTPQALEREFYVTASAMGCMVVVALWHFQVERLFQELLGMLAVVALRYAGQAREHRRGENY